ncbi:MAG: HNH endonuclease [Bacteroidetes bacterium RIFCSPLOWO2_02_FULL_36_8]|nr:MAG: HNH endonuclease [Bacteroidetes bacterium RIFCSPLOWO2_02_FULL_36_8]OFY69345.1 MAG: HNH endonuclease [Bacteroidetes bacterium RIFCSPLOWO2_12_FULL_37_12]
MNQRVLVLNQDFQAVNTCTYKKGFLLVYMDKAEVVNVYPNKYIHSPRFAYPLPSIIRLKDFVKLPFKSIMLTKHNVLKRDNYECQYCGSSKELTLDHLMPRSRGGAHSWTNVVTACKNCNSRKGDSTPEEAKMNLRNKPFRPSFIMYLRNFSGGIDEAWKNYLYYF